MTHLAGKVVVITGASSGLGRETAREFAKHGCILFLAARRADALEETARLCVAAGGSPEVVVTDVTREDDVNALARAALARTGSIDVWVNNAGVTLFGPLEGAPFEEHRRVIETNVFGPMYAARAVVPVFRRQKHGVMINVGSILSKVGQPFVPSYVISKFALRGLSEALRCELADEPDVHVCSIFPYAVNTPHFQSGANHTGREPHAMPPDQPPGKVARAIVELSRRPRREVHVPRIAVVGLALHAVWPRTVERLLLHALREWHFSPDRQLPTDGNLYRAAEEPGSVHGVRPPRLSTLGLFAWVLREVLRIESDFAREALVRWRRRANSVLRSPSRASAVARFERAEESRA
jgi:NAD(P)-dependent dehydrogenase (short-subunit alcohol dehydrogenase family)